MYFHMMFLVLTSLFHLRHRVHQGLYNIWFLALTWFKFEKRRFKFYWLYAVYPPQH